MRWPTRAGWAIALAEADGGVGLSWVEAAVLLEQIGRHTAPVPFLPSLLALMALAGADEAAAAAGRRGRRASGGVGRRPGLGRADRLRGLEHASRTRCVPWRRARTWTVSGRIGPVEGAAVADIAVVVAGDDVFAVELDASDRPPAEAAMDGTRVLSWLTLDEARATRIGGAALATEILDRGAVGASAEILGGSDRVLEMAVQYAKDRVQFDQPIGSFQAIKHRCADMLVDVEGMRSSTWYAAWAISAGDPDASAAASTAKVWSSDAAKRVMASGLQVHGGIGFTWEHDLHLYMKRSQFDRLSYGDAVYHRERLAGLLRSRLVSGSGIF